MKRIIDFVVKYPVLITALLCVVFYFLPFKPKPFGDGEYHEGTIQLIQFVLNGFQGTVRIDKGLFTLFYYLIPYSLAYVFHDDTVYYFFGIIFNSVVICGGVYYLWKSFDLLHLSNKSKFWTLLILNAFPIHIYYAMGILAEAGSFFAVCLWIYLGVKIWVTKSQAPLDFMLLAITLLMLIGFRPNLIPFVFVFLGYLWIKMESLKNKMVFTVTLGATVFFMIYAEKTLNATDGQFKKAEFIKQLVWSRYELRDEPFNWLPQHGQDKFASTDYLNNLAKRRELDSICEVNKLDKNSYYINWVANDIIHNPLMTLRQYSLKFFQSQSFIISPLMKSNKSNFVKWGVHIFINSINYILVFASVWGMLLLVRDKEYELFFLFLLLWGSALSYVFLFHSEQRYLFPVRPVLIFLFAYSINYYDKRKSVFFENI